ncbi:hypothetical protein [Tenacibaculum aiptasiae]|uniref:hypothetical protein n=1 Tax=Tenacibaculum aiptasiae TaxID=426481 RepID=UPI003B5CE228
MKKEADCWEFKFCLEKANGERLSEKKARELMEVIISWAEENSNQVGGGYSGVNDEDVIDKSPLFPILEEEE